MLDLADVDHQLAALGQAPEDLAALVAQHGGLTSSLLEADRALAALAAGRLPATDARATSQGAPRPMSSRPAAAAPKAPSLRPPSLQDTLVEHPAISASVASPGYDSGSLDADTAALLASDVPLPQQEPASAFDAFSEPSDEPEPLEAAQPSASAPANARSERPPLTDLFERPASEAPRSGRLPSQPAPGLGALLDQDLDPNDFPRTPPPERPAVQAALRDGDDDEIEMLLEDEELIEIGDDEPAGS